MTNREEIDQLRAELDQLKASVAPTPDDPAAAAQWQSKMHELAERRASAFNPFTRDQLAEMERACPTSTMRDIVRDNQAPQGPSSQGAIPSSQAVSNVRGVPGSGTGWAHQAPLTNPPGTAQADRLMDEQDRRDRLALMAEEAKRRAMMKAIEPK